MLTESEKTQLLDRPDVSVSITEQDRTQAISIDGKSKTVEEARSFIATALPIEYAKANKIAQIYEYDRSSARNAVKIVDATANSPAVELVFGFELRTKIRERIELAEASGADVVLQLGSIKKTLPVVQAKTLLSAITNYAAQVYDKTQAHLVAVEALTSTQAVEKYDHTAGYPVQLDLSGQFNG